MVCVPKSKVRPEKRCTNCAGRLSIDSVIICYPPTIRPTSSSHERQHGSRDHRLQETKPQTEQQSDDIGSNRCNVE